MPAATRALNLDGYDLIVSSESGPIKGIRKPAGARHICYCHTPMRYLWDMHDDYYRSAGIGGKIAMKLFTKYLRKEDLKSAESVDTFIANSAFVAERIKRIYGRDPVVIHPPVDVGFFASAATLEETKRFVDEKGIADLVEFAGEISDAGVYMACGKVLIAPSRWEGMPYLLLEAVARGRHIIASDCPGNRDVVKNYAQATLFPVEDSIALAGLLS